MKIAVVLHLYYHDLWEEFSEQLKRINHGFDLYVTLTIGSSPDMKLHTMREQILLEYPRARVFVLENKGLDIGAFLIVLKNLISSGEQYDLLLKLHSKKSILSCGPQRGEYWRKELYRPLFDNLPRIIELMQTNEQIGMVGSRLHLYDFEGVNIPTINYFRDLLNIHTPQRIFVGGTMFWVRYTILTDYLNPSLIDEIIHKLEDGYFTDAGIPRFTHAMERIFGYMISDSQKVIAGI